MAKNILIVGGAGYIGSHINKALTQIGYNTVVFDNFSTGHRDFVKWGKLIEGDMSDYNLLCRVLKDYEIDCVMHFAAFAYVGESVTNPRKYYVNNVQNTITLLNAMVECKVHKFIFSSSCAIFGEPKELPIIEETPKAPINPYGKTKLMVENILEDYSSAYGLNFVALRYFNAAGCSEDGDIGESHNPETHLIPLVLQSMTDNNKQLKIFGNDYDTPDGTCIRDYIHVNDLADAHVRSIEYLNKNDIPVVINLGTGDGNSVMEVIKTAEKVTGKKANFVMNPRRAGDPAILVADNKKARKVLGWKPRYSLEQIIETAWKWHSNKKY